VITSVAFAIPDTEIALDISGWRTLLIAMHNSAANCHKLILIIAFGACDGGVAPDLRLSLVVALGTRDCRVTPDHGLNIAGHFALDYLIGLLQYL
jgi:hypothetical protein